MKFLKDSKSSAYGYKAIWVLFWYRLGNYVYYCTLPKMIRKIILIILKICQIIFAEIPLSIEIPFSARIDEGIRLSHTYGIVLNGHVKIGKNCTIFQNVTIGAIEGKGITDKAPQIGDSAYIGAGAKILGNIKIGNNVKIGANAVVVKDVPNNCTVVGNPARIIYRNNSSKKSCVSQ